MYNNLHTYVEETLKVSILLSLKSLSKLKIKSAKVHLQKPIVNQILSGEK